MLKLGEIVVIQQLKDEGLSIKAIASRTGLDRKTVRKHLKRGLQAPLYGPRAPRPCLLDPFRDYVMGRLTDYPELRACRLLREIRELGYRGGYTMVKEFVAKVRPAKEQGWEHRFETPPGKQAQVDFACFDVCFTSEPAQTRRIWVFTLVLGYSRHLWGRFVLRQDLPTLVRLHREAFTALGGVPRQILYDRMKTAVIDEPDPGHIVYNARLLDMATHYGFTPKACAAYRAKTKGKVERPNGYIRDDFFLGRRFADLEDLNRQWFQWLDTTQRRLVEIQVTCDHVHILDDGALVAIHDVLRGRGQRVVAQGHRRYPPPGNARRPRQRASEAPRPGQQVGRRDLTVYQCQLSLDSVPRFRVIGSQAFSPDREPPVFAR